MIEKSRFWSSIGYPESIHKNWIEELRKTNLRVIISPLHDKDIDNETGEPLKPHYHILICWDGPVTMKNALELCESIGLSKYVEKVRSVSNIINYMTHDSYTSKDKYKYSADDIIFINCQKSEFIKIGYREIIEYIRKNNIKQFNRLVDKLISDNENELLEYVSQKTYYVNTYLSSLKIDIDKDIAQTYSLLKGLANEIDLRGKISLDKKTYDKLIETFEQLDIFGLDDI